jgi:hypothetical protein
LADHSAAHIIGHPIDKEQAQHLDALPFEPFLLAKVFLDGVANLCGEDGRLVGPLFLADLQFHVVGEPDVLPARVDLVHLEPRVILAFRLLR